MAYIAVDSDGTETIFTAHPDRSVKHSFVRTSEGFWSNTIMAKVQVPKGTSLKLTGNQMTWGDEPFKLK